MICKHCLEDLVEYGPLGYCPRCGVWYKEEGVEELGVYEYCTTKDSDPELCDDFIRSLDFRPVETPGGEDIPIVNTTIANMRRADKICAECENKNFVLE